MAYIKLQNAIKAIKEYALEAYDIDLDIPEQFAGSNPEERFCEGLYEATEVLEDIPAADVVEVVRCQDCRFCEKHPTSDKLKICTNEQQWVTDCYPLVYDNDFCSFGKKERIMTDNEIRRDLLRCANKEVSFCKECRHRNYGDRCCIQLMQDSLTLINRQKADIEELKSDIAILKDSNINLQELYYTEKEKVTQAKQKVTDACKMLKTTKSEAIKEFAERLKERLLWSCECEGEFVLKSDIDNLVKEMVGEQ